MRKTNRRGFLGIIAATSTISAISPKRVGVMPVVSEKLNAGAPAELEDFIYDITHGSNSWSGAGGNAKEATVEEFPISQSIAGVIMQLNPGGFRELHWHSIAAEWAFVLEGKVRTTIITPGGTTSTDDFEVGDTWYFPKGYGH